MALRDRQVHPLFSIGMFLCIRLINALWCIHTCIEGRLFGVIIIKNEP